MGEPDGEVTGITRVLEDRLQREVVGVRRAVVGRVLDDGRVQAVHWCGGRGKKGGEELVGMEGVWYYYSSRVQSIREIENPPSPYLRQPVRSLARRQQLPQDDDHDRHVVRPQAGLGIHRKEAVLDDLLGDLVEWHGVLHAADDEVDHLLVGHDVEDPVGGDDEEVDVFVDEHGAHVRDRADQLLVRPGALDVLEAGVTEGPGHGEDAVDPPVVDVAAGLLDALLLVWVVWLVVLGDGHGAPLVREDEPGVPDVGAVDEPLHDPADAGGGAADHLAVLHQLLCLPDLVVHLEAARLDALGKALLRLSELPENDPTKLVGQVPRDVLAVGTVAIEDTEEIDLLVLRLAA